MQENTDREAEQLKNEIHARIHRHRRWVFVRTLLLIVLILGALYFLYHTFTYREYRDFVEKSVEDRSDTPATKFVHFSDGILKYSNDGAFFTSSENELVWNQTFEMENPIVDIRDGYVAIGDVGGTELYLIDKEGNRGHLSTTIPIYAFSIASQGTTAVLLSGDNEYYLRIYDADAKELASGELFVRNSGYPVSLSISPGGKKLALASIVPTGREVSTTLTFYNFGSVGQNEEDNIVGTYQYERLVVPEISFLTEELLAAFGDDRVLLFTGAQKPTPSEEIPVEEEIRSVFYEKNHFGLIVNSNDEENSRHMAVYDRRGRLVMEKDFTMDYDTVEFLPNGEILVRNDYECALFNLQGVERFRYTFDEKLLAVLPEQLGIYYTFLMEGSTKKVRLK